MVRNVISYGGYMSKKQGPMKHVASSKSALLNHLFEVGNFLRLRRVAHEIVGASDSSDKERSLAQFMLKLTLPDALALLAGALCLAFSVSVAFVVAY
jgi:hypothetical protein